jgi:nucleoside-diphosphate-sugar epimerase
MNMKTVGIIGGSGYIGSYNTKKFLAEGYRVKASVTDRSRSDKYEHLRQLPQADQLEIVELDVRNKAQLEAFVQGCQVVVHGGTPFQLEVEDPQKDLFEPTIKGTENFLETVRSTAGVEKVVFIASVAALNTHFPLLPDHKNPGDQISEQDAPFISAESHPYAQAKFKAHQAVEAFIADHPDLPFEIVTVSPVGVMGRALSEREDSTSMGVQYLFKNRIAPNPFIQMFYDQNVDWAIVDVEDVAEGIYKAATIQGIHGRNYLLSSESYPVSDVSLMLNHKAPKGAAKIVYRNDLAQKELGIQFKPAQVSLNSYDPEV